ncbi:MAG: YbjQ family protein [Synergistaceae bacterium]|nr:YbjQ family protein [Synergistota bacterium]NLM72265.1 YbjQ family protein [Synergistaceae bacterium]
MSNKKIPVLTVDVIPGKRCEYLGCVTASCCLSKSLVQDVASNVRNWTVGGELTRYTAMIDQAVELAAERLGEQARKMGANAVIGFRLSTTSISTGAAEIIAYGTAVRFAELEDRA